jgi:16S rRNA (guanine527-N7)-methyltransferase
MSDVQTVSRETNEKLTILKDMLSKWNRTLNLVSASSLAHFDARHLKDSAQIVRFAPENIQAWLDIGSGGGFPGLVVAALLHERQPQCRLTLVEADHRKCVFLREAARAMHVDVDVVSNRIENIVAHNADVVSARALASLKALCAYTKPHLAEDGVALFLKGANHEAEMREAEADGWRFDLTVHNSVTDPHGAILELRSLQHDRS